MADKGMLIVFSGPSGVGKDSVLKTFLSESQDCVRSVTATTRAPRNNEEHGRDYYFITREEFKSLIEKGEILEYNEYNGNLYGTMRKDIEQLLDQGKNVILRIDVNGSLRVRELYPEAVLIFLAPPSWRILEDRLRRRGTESAEVIEARLTLARYELSKAREYDYIIVNDFVELSSKRLSAVIIAAGCSAERMKTLIEEDCRNA